MHKAVVVVVAYAVANVPVVLAMTTFEVSMQAYPPVGNAAAIAQALPFVPTKQVTLADPPAFFRKSVMILLRVPGNVDAINVVVVVQSPTDPFVPKFLFVT